MDDATIAVTKDSMAGANAGSDGVTEADAKRCAVSRRISIVETKFCGKNKLVGAEIAVEIFDFLSRIYLRILSRFEI